jgi:secreted trypsin-like serine protease
VKRLTKASVILWATLPAAVLSATPVARIIGGDNTSESYPWMAGIHTYDASGMPASYSFYPFCGGSLIAPGWVVTAGHCLTAPGSGADPADYDFLPAELILRLDRPDLGDISNPAPQPDTQPEHFVSRLIVHPLYGVNTDFDHDIALIQLTEKTSFPTISLADNLIFDHLESSSLLDDVVQILGWGVYDDTDFDPDNAADGNQPRYLQQARIDYLPYSQRRCRNGWSGMTTNMVCAWEPDPDPVTAPNGQDSCLGDSGGPLLLPRNTLLSSGIISADWLIGATSFGDPNCTSESLPGVYTRLTNFPGWIETATASANDPLVDLSTQLTLPVEVHPNQTVEFVVGAINQSHSNTATLPTLDVVAGAGLALTPVEPAGCTSIAGGWRCSLAATLTAGASDHRHFTGTWSGDAESLMSVTATIRSTEDDYRIANNTAKGQAIVTALPDPELSSFSVLSNRNGKVTLQLSARNLSTVNDALDAIVGIELTAGLDLSADEHCELVSATELACHLGVLAAGETRLIAFSAAGSGDFAAHATLENSNGDRLPGDTSSSIALTFRRSGSGVLPAGWLLLLLFGYRFLSARNQSSN